jgi:two-component system KDP operon response regulator KdpE
LEPSSKWILVVDDDADTCTMIQEVLSDEGYTVEWCLSGEEARDLLGQDRFDLVLADIKMPRISGIELLQEVRERCLDVWVILMTAYASLDTAIQALRGDADDYLVKPFSLQELRQRVWQALLDEQDAEGVFRYRDLRVDTNARRIWLGGREVALTRQEFDVLACLAERPRCTVSWQELMQKVWGYNEPTKADVGMLRSCIRRLRQKLGDNAREPRYIINRWGEGYRLGG